MAIITVSSAITGLSEDADASEKASGIFQHIPKGDCNIAYEENQENIHDIGCNEIVGNSNHTKMSDNSIGNDYPNDDIHLNEFDEDDRVGDNVNRFDNNIGTSEKISSKRFFHLIDSDSEGETNDSQSSRAANCIKNDSYQSVKELTDGESVDVIDRHISGYRVIIDSDSEQENEKQSMYNPTDICNSTDASVQEKSIKKKKLGSIRASKDEARRRIHSETQRLLRETEISLPYHKPKQRTLQEFLNRKRLSMAFPKASSTAAKLKISSTIVSQALAEKEKEAEAFYKSSDSEDDAQQSVSLIGKNINESSVRNENSFPADIENIYNEDTTRLSFEDLSAVNCQITELTVLTKSRGDIDNKLDPLTLRISKEYKQNSQNIDMSRGLLDIDVKSKTRVVDASDDRQRAIAELEDDVSHESEVRQCDTEVSNENRDNSPITETRKISELSTASNEQVGESLLISSNNDVTSTYADDCIIKIDGNNEREGSNVKTSDTLLSAVSFVSDTQRHIVDNYPIAKFKSSDNRAIGLTLPMFPDAMPIDRNKILSNPSSTRITLKGSPGMIIDLTDDMKGKEKGVSTLLDRFFCKHIVNIKKQIDDKSEITVVLGENAEIDPVGIKQVSPYKLAVNIDNTELNKPGAKFTRLKEDLKLQMTLKRNKEWQQKEIESQAQEEEEEEEEEEEDNHNLSGKEGINNFDLSDSGESEPEENDVCIKDKKESKCLFVDDEAEVTNDETEETGDEAEETGDEVEEAGNKAEETGDEGSDTRTEKMYNKSDTDTKENKSNTSSKCESEREYTNICLNEIVFDRIEENLNADTGSKYKNNLKDDDNDKIGKSVDVVIKKYGERKRSTEEFKDDSNVTFPNYLKNESRSGGNTTDLNVKRLNENNRWTDEDEEGIPVFQHQTDSSIKSQMCKTPLSKRSMLDLVSPATQLSVLNVTLDSDNKNSSDTRGYPFDKDDSNFIRRTQSDTLHENTCNVRNKTILQKKLFDDVTETIDDEYLLQLCSGKFGFTQKTGQDLKNLSSQFDTSELQLRELCSGNFDAKSVDTMSVDTMSVDTKQLENVEIENEISHDVQLAIDEETDNLLSHTKKVARSVIIQPELKLRVVSSDDENQSDDADTFLKIKRRPFKRLRLSDSEDESAGSSDEQNDDVNNEEVEEYVDYDSEENEVTIASKTDIRKVAATFLEEEAELSESEWESADEDEKDLDKLELEEADDEHIDEQKIKDQLEKIRMRQLLDEDKRDVRLLKELLFEDGDLYADGMGRERKFKWKNIDNTEYNTDEISQVSDQNDGWVDVQEDEDDVKWSKLRHERDKFIEEKMKSSTSEIEDELCDSKIFKLGLDALRRIKSKKSKTCDASVETTNPVEDMEPIMPRNLTDLLNDPNTGKKSQTIYNVIKKRSLLTRGEESLARIATLAKQGDFISHRVNTKNFVFQYMGPSISNASKEGSGVKEENSQNLLNKPRKRKMTLDSTSVTRKKRK